MTNPFKPMTNLELKKVFRDYRTAFSDWKVEHDVTLTRTAGPIKQTIAFERLRGGGYRPSCSTSLLLLVPDGGQLLFQFLDPRFQMILPRDHPKIWPNVVAAMENKFAPSIRAPLSAHKTLEIAENEARRTGTSNLNCLSSLAALNAYLGDSKRAVKLCKKTERAFVRLGRDPADWEIAKRRFSHDLIKAIESRTERRLLDPEGRFDREGTG